MLNEYAYCPRLCWLEWVEAEFADSVDTVDGRFQHRRVDREEGALADPDSAREGERAGQEKAASRPWMIGMSRARSVMMSDADLGLIARMDLVEDAGGSAVPVDVKRGRAGFAGRRVRTGTRAALCAGPDLACQRIHLRPRRDLLRTVAAPRDNPIRRSLDCTHHRTAGPDARHGRAGGSSPATRGQPQMPSVLAGGHMPSRRDQHATDG